MPIDSEKLKVYKAIQKKVNAGASMAPACKEFNIPFSSFHYWHKKNSAKKSVAKAPKWGVKKRHVFTEIPLNQPESQQGTGKVAILIGDVSSIKSVMAELWK